jgi:hypothetical protein
LLATVAHRLLHRSFMCRRQKTADSRQQTADRR